MAKKIKIVQNQPVRMLHIEFPHADCDKFFGVQMDEIHRGTYVKGMHSGPKSGSKGNITEVIFLIAEDRADAFLEAISK